MSADSWLYWHWGKEDKVDEDIPRLELLFRKNHVSSILDLGCGTGRHSVYFARRQFKVSGFDWSEASVKRARGLLRAGKLSADLKVWNMTQFPYPYEDSSFDAVVSTRVIHHAKLQTIKEIIGEIERITAKRGFLYIQVPTVEELVRYREEGRKFDDVEPGTVLPLGGDEKGILHHHFKMEELLSLFSEFKVLDLKVRQEHYCLTARKK